MYRHTRAFGRVCWIANISFDEAAQIEEICPQFAGIYQTTIVPLGRAEIMARLVIPSESKSRNRIGGEEHDQQELGDYSRHIVNFDRFGLPN
jgi:hypothetical protein